MELVWSWYGVGMEEWIWENLAQLNIRLHLITFDNLIEL